MTLTPRVIDDSYLFMVASSSVLLANKVKPNAAGGFDIDATFRRHVELIASAQADPEIALILGAARNKEGIYVLGGRLTNRFVDEGDSRRLNLERVLYSSIFTPGLSRVSAMLTATMLIGQIPLDTSDLKFYSLSLELRKQALKELDLIVAQIADIPEEPVNDTPRSTIYLALNLDPLTAQNTQSNSDLRPEHFTLSRAGQPVVGVRTYRALYLYPGESLSIRVFITSRGPNYGEFFDQTFTLASNTLYPYILTNPALPYDVVTNPPAVDTQGDWMVNTQAISVQPSEIALALATAINTLSLNTGDGGICNIMAAPHSGGQHPYDWERSLEVFWDDSNIVQAVAQWQSVPSTVATVQDYLDSFDATSTSPNDQPGYGIARRGTVVTDLMELRLAPRRTGGASTSEMLTLYPLVVDCASYLTQSGQVKPVCSHPVPEIVIGSYQDYGRLVHDRPVSAVLGLDNANNEGGSADNHWDTFYFNAVNPTGGGRIKYRITSQAEPGITYETDFFTWGMGYNPHGEPAAALALVTAMSGRMRPDISPELQSEDVLAAFAHPHAVQMIAWRGSVILAPTFQVRVVVDILELPEGLQVAVGDVNDLKPNSLWGGHASVAVEYQFKKVNIMTNNALDGVNELIKDPDVTAKVVKPRKMRSAKFQAALDRVERAEQRNNQYDIY